MLSTPLRHPKPQAPLRLYCFPYAGGNAQIFSSWHNLTSSSIEVVAVQYPGRSERFMEPPIDNCTAMAKAIAADINAGADKPFALLGYSMGGAIAYETLRYLDQTPLALFLCASRPPQINRKQRHVYDDAQLVEEIKTLGGIDERLLQDPEMRALIIAMMRADFKLLDTYHAQPQDLTCPTHIIYGANDPHVPSHTAKRWGELCQGNVFYHEVNGEHFFMRSHRDELLNYITQHLATVSEHFGKVSIA
ncbi:MAG: hypothetical protein B0W54_05645 [Cellvibrio sp. 79]|nr:MAG: hypothetical protein B0W54_05645 [Cellvibrio sp. 79]